MAVVSAAKAKEYSPEELSRAVAEHIGHLGLPEGLTPESRVVIKPNLIIGKPPEQAATTHPAFVEAVVRALQAAGAHNITIVDSPGGPFTQPMLRRVYTVTGMAEVAQRCGVALGYDTSYVETQAPEAQLCRSFDIAGDIANADLIINLAKLKSHGMTTLSAGVKNLFGCVVGLRKSELHFRYPQKQHFGSMLVDLCELMRPSLTFIDAVDAMEGDGPTAGQRRFVGLTLAARDVYALDRLLCHLVGFAPQEVPTVAEAIRRGLCSPNVEDITVLGQPIEPIKDFLRPHSSEVDFVQRIPAAIRPPFAAISRRFLAPRPVVVPGRCVGCAKCAESCPPKVISMVQHKAKIDYSGCIRCYCCQELCPEKAVEIRRPSLLRF